MAEKSPIRPTDDDARNLARTLLSSAKFGALGVIDPDSNAPFVTRVAVAKSESGAPMTLISDLSHHTRALRANPRCSLLVGEPGEKGDPLNHPRLTIQADADFVDRTSDAHSELRALYLTQIPKAKLYIDFLDFSLVRLRPINAFLNGGFGKAFVLSADDLAAP